MDSLHLAIAPSDTSSADADDSRCVASADRRSVALQETLAVASGECVAHLARFTTLDSLIAAVGAHAEHLLELGEMLLTRTLRYGTSCTYTHAKHGKYTRWG